MKKINFPFFAVGIGLFILLVVLRGKEIDEQGATALPLLTLLAINEIAFILNAIGVYLGIKRMKAEGSKLFDVVIVILCGVLAITFTVLGIDLFPQ